MSFIPTSSKTGRTEPPAITPVPSLAGFNKILLALYFTSISCAIVEPFNFTSIIFLKESSTAFLIESGTSFYFPKP